MTDSYHADTTRISKSGLDLIARSPAHYWQSYLAPEPQRVKRKSKEFDIGTAFHLLALEPEKFSEAVALVPKVDLRTRDGRERMISFEEEHGNKLLLTQEDVESVQRMRDSLFRHPTARAALTGELLVEHTVIWDDPTTGAPCKCRFDSINRTLGVAPDLKTTADASIGSFAKSVANYRYHVQQAFYSDGLDLGQENDLLRGISFLFIAVEKEPPYGVAVYELDGEAVNIGRALYRRDLETYMRCRVANSWPAYSNDVQSLSLPGWTKKYE